MFDLETTGLLSDPEAEISLFGCLTDESLLTTTSLDVFLDAFMRQRIQVGPGNIKVVSFNGKNFDVPFLKKQFVKGNATPPLLKYFLEVAEDPKRHVDLMAWSAKVFNDEAKDLSVEEIEAQMDKNSRLRIHKDDACKLLDIYVPRSIPAKGCAIISKRFFANEDGEDERRRFYAVHKHCAIDLTATYELYSALSRERWLK